MRTLSDVLMFVFNFDFVKGKNDVTVRENLYVA